MPNSLTAVIFTINEVTSDPKVNLSFHSLTLQKKLQSFFANYGCSKFERLKILHF